MAFPLLCSELRPIIQRRVEVIFHQETKGAVPPNHAVPLCISNDGLRRQIDEDGRRGGCLQAFQTKQGPVSRREAFQFGRDAL